MHGYVVILQLPSDLGTNSFCHRHRLTYNFVLSVRQVVADHAAYVRPETVADAVYVVRRGPGVSEMCVELSRTLGHQSGVAERRQVAREERQRLPVHREHVVVSSVKVRCAHVTIKKK